MRAASRSAVTSVTCSPSACRSRPLGDGSFQRCCEAGVALFGLAHSVGHGGVLGSALGRYKGIHRRRVSLASGLAGWRHADDWLAG